MSAMRSKTNRGESGDIQWLPLAELDFDARVNRQVNTHRVEQIVKDFDPEAIGVLTVSERMNGSRKYVVIDGQHRCAALVKMGWADQKVPCHVRGELSIAEEAGLFVKLNNTAKPKAYERFMKSVTAGDPEAMAIDKIVRSVGLKVSDQQVDGTLTAVQALEKIYRGDKFTGGESAHVLAGTLRLSTNAWGKTCGAVNANVIQGLALVLRKHGAQIDVDDLLKKLSPYSGGPTALLGRARGLRDLRGGTVPNCVAAIVVDVYNKGRRSTKLPGWFA